MSQDPIYQQSVAPPQNSTLSIVSLISGILGWTFFPFIGSIVAVITGHMAKREIRDSNGTIGGDGMATAGLILGWASIIIGVLVGCGFAAFFVLIPLIGIASGEFSALPLLLSFL